MKVPLKSTMKRAFINGARIGAFVAGVAAPILVVVAVTSWLRKE